jgi:hypothetical protein
MELRRRLTTSREKVGEDGDDGGAKRRSSACTAALQVRLGGGGVLEQLRLRFSEEEEGATAAPSPRSAQRTAANNDGKDGDFRQVFFDATDELNFSSSCEEERREIGRRRQQEGARVLWFGGLILRRGESDWRQVEEAQAMR